MRVIREAVILAAGLGTRLRDYLGIVKYLAGIQGKPLISYPLKALKWAGVEHVHLVVNPMHGTELVEAARREFGRVDYVENPYPERENGYSLLLAKKLVSEEYFYVSMADHIYQPDILEILSRKVDGRAVIVMGGDSRPRYIDVAEATKILAPGGLVQRVGKEVRNYTHIDVGVHVFSRRIYEIIGRDIPEKLRLADIVNMAVSRGFTVRVADVTGAAWTEIDTPSDYEEVVGGTRRPVVEAFYRSLGL